jgi:Flp pilus assembly protein TadD
MPKFLLGRLVHNCHLLALLWLFLTSPSASAQLLNRDEEVRKAYQTGEKAVQAGDLALAESSFLRVLELVPRDVGARVNLGVVFMRQQRWDQALKYLNQAETLAPQVTGIRLNIALVHYRQGAYADAIPDFQTVLQQQPDSAQARRLLGLCYLFEERYVDAATYLEPLWPVASNDLSYLYSLAVAAGNCGRHELEERAEKKLLEAGTDSPLVHLLLGKAYLGHEDYANALVELQKAAEADPKLPMVHYNLGMVYRHNGDLQKAQSEFLKDIELEPSVAFNYDQLGLLASLDGKDKQAEAYFLDAVKRDAKLGTSWFGLAKIYRQQKRYQAALTALQQAASIDPSSASVHYLRAQVLAATGRKTDAQTEFAAVQKLKQDSVDKLEQEISGTRYRDPQLPTQ